jgi:thioredoxin reductase
VTDEIREPGMLDCAAVPVQDEQSRFTTQRRRRLCNQLIRQIELEVGNVHSGTLNARLTQSCPGGSRTLRTTAQRGCPLAATVSVYDTLIVGGGPAGLNAALVLGRCGRRVLLCDAATPRNARSRELHCFLTRDGIAPLDLLRLGRAELNQYGIESRSIEVIDVRRAAEVFDVTLADDTQLAARTVLIACGVTDELPDIPGLADCFGITAHHCPYCDGWESRGKSIVVIGQKKNGAALTLALKTWSDRIMLCSNGAAQLRRVHREQLAEHAIAVNESPIGAVEHSAGHVNRLVLASNESIACEAIFLVTTQRIRSDLAGRLGCSLTRRGLVKTDHLGQTNVPGVYVVGDASRDVQFAIVAAAEGAKAAIAINKALQTRAGFALFPVT